MRFGDEDADFSKSLSLWGHSSSTPLTIFSLHASAVAYERSEHCWIIPRDLEISFKHDKQALQKHQCQSLQSRGIVMILHTVSTTSTGNTGEQTGQIRIKWGKVGMMMGFQLFKFTVKTGLYTEQIRKKVARFSVLEYYTTDSACPWKTGGPVNSLSVDLACLCLSSPQNLRGQWWPSVQTCSGRWDKGAKTMKSDIYQTETFLPGMAHLHGSLDFSVLTKQTLFGTLRNVGGT